VPQTLNLKSLIETVVQILGPVQIAIVGAISAVALGICGLVAIIWAANSLGHRDYVPVGIVGVGAVALIWGVMKISKRSRM
jgi:hypothetical protein